MPRPDPSIIKQDIESRQRQEYARLRALQRASVPQIIELREQGIASDKIVEVHTKFRDEEAIEIKVTSTVLNEYILEKAQKGATQDGKG